MKKSSIYALVALILVFFGFTLPAVCFYKVPQKIAAGQVDSIPAYVYPMWNLYQTGRYVSPYSPRDGGHDLKKMIEYRAEVGMMSLPIWRVSLEAPNYPKASFPEGIPVWFHMDGFSGDVHEMDTINHYVGMYPMEAGAARERAAGPFILLAMSVFLLVFIAWKNPLSRWLLLLPALFPPGFFAFFAGWMYWYGHNMQAWGAFKLKPFTPTSLGVGHVAHFTTASYPAIGFWVLLVVAILSLLAILSRTRELREEAALAAKKD